MDLVHRVASRFGSFYKQAPTAMLSLDAGTLADDINGAAAFVLRHRLVSGAHLCAFGHDAGDALALWAAAICPRVMAVSAAYPARKLWRVEGIHPHGFMGSHVHLHLDD